MQVPKFNGRKIGKHRPAFIIAEAGVNHNGKLDVAFKLIEEAAKCGADAVKFQTFNAERIATETAPKANYQVQRQERAESQREMLRRLELSAEDHQNLVECCRQSEILFMSSAFDEKSADLLDKINVAVFKIPSGEITNLPLLTYTALMKKPMIVSTGMSTLGEVERAVKTIENAGNSDIVLLHCVSEYPAQPCDVNLRAMKTMEAAFQLPVGFSDHTLGIEISIAAVALGACVIEKHFTLDRKFPGPDHLASLDPDEFRAMAQGIRNVESAIGHGRKEPTPGESETSAVARKSLVAACDILADTVITDQMINIKRPGTGMLPSDRKYLIGRRTRRYIPAGTLIQLEMLE